MILTALPCKPCCAEATLWKKKGWIDGRKKKKERDLFMTQVIKEPTKENTQLNLILTNKERLDGNLETGSSHGCSDHEMEKFSILQRGDKNKSKITMLNFRRAVFFLWWTCLEGSCEMWTWREEGSRRASWLSGIWKVKVNRKLAGWTRWSWQDSNIKKK